MRASYTCSSCTNITVGSVVLEPTSPFRSLADVRCRGCGISPGEDTGDVHERPTWPDLSSLLRESAEELDRELGVAGLAPEATP